MEDRHSGIATLKKNKRPARTSGLSVQNMVEVYRSMVLCRTLDERVWVLNRQGKAAIVASAQGHEAAQMGSVWALDRTRDWFYVYYRDLAAIMALGVTPKELLLGFLAKAGEPFSGARQFPLHGAYLKYRVISQSNVVSTQIPQAVGAALASKMRGEGSVIITYFGDGGASEGDCHEGMNFAGVHKLPIIFFCENNKYAISVPLKQQMAIENVADRADGYGFPGVIVDGTDLLEVYRVTREAAQRARRGDGPTLIEAKVERYLPHTSDDDDRRYRAPGEVEEARKRDPLKMLKEYFLSKGIVSQEQDKEIADAARREVNEATEYAESAPYPEPHDFYDHVYASPGGRPFH